MRYTISVTWVNQYIICTCMKVRFISNCLSYKTVGVSWYITHISTYDIHGSRFMMCHNATYCYHGLTISSEPRFVYSLGSWKYDRNVTARRGFSVLSKVSGYQEYEFYINKHMFIGSSQIIRKAVTVFKNIQSGWWCKIYKVITYLIARKGKTFCRFVWIYTQWPI